MIELSRLNGNKFVLNCDLIKTMEATPDTVITLTTGEKLMVLEPIAKVIADTVAFRQCIAHGPPPASDHPVAAAVAPGGKS